MPELEDFEERVKDLLRQAHERGVCDGLEKAERELKDKGYDKAAEWVQTVRVVPFM